MNSKAEWLPPPGGRLAFLLAPRQWRVATCTAQSRPVILPMELAEAAKNRSPFIRFQGVARGTQELTSARFQEFARSRLMVFSNRLHVAAASPRGRYRQGPHL